MPGGVTPPIAVVPTVPGVTPPAGNTTATIVDGRTVVRAPPNINCREGARSPTGEAIDCTNPPLAASEGFGRSAPITPGREFAEEPLWNVWADGRYTGTSDHRYNLDIKGRGGYLTLGADRRVKADLVAGVSLSLEDNRSEGFGGAMVNESNGFSIGPYIGYRLTPEWSMDASLGFGRLENDNRIDVLSGRYTTNRYSASVNTTGQYMMGEYQLRPKASVSYSYFDNGAYSMSGTVIGLPVTLQVAKNSFDYGVTEAGAEVSRVFKMSGGTVVVPYAEFALRYEFERPNSGQILTGNLTYATPSPWVGSLRAGARALVSRDTFIEASIGYLSLWQNGLNVWEGRLFLSRAF
jgi:outer membrane autotransporter protein